MAEINVSILIEEAFGVKVDDFNPDFKSMPIRQETGKAAGTPFYSKFGKQEYFLPITFTYTEDSPLDTNDNASLSIEKTIELPPSLVSISSKMDIVETKLTERRGTVKEMISLGDYEINIRGFVIGPNRNDLPEDIIAQLRALRELGKPIKMACALTDIFLVRPDRLGSDEVVIVSFDLLEMRGSKNVIPYVMRLISDEPFSLIDIS